MPSNRREFLKESVATAALGGLGATAVVAGGAESKPNEVFFQRRVAVRRDVDVFVAGGGPSGVAAAVAAARQGAKVFLAERNTCLGGMGTAGMLPLFMPYSDGVRNLAAGIGADVLRRLKVNGGFGPDSDVTIRAEVLKRAVDIHAAKSDLASYKRYAEDFKNLRYRKGESYGIPYRCLVPRKLTNVLVAGRCVSSDRYVQSSIRVMPGCFITGQAIGAAAAICVQQGCDTRGVPVPELQRRLKAMGAYLPNC